MMSSLSRCPLFLEMPIPSRSLLRLVALGITSAAAVVFTASAVKPTFLSKRVGPRISIPVATSDEKALLRAPWARLSYTDALATSIFLWDRSAFAMDLMGTGKVGVARALALADVAVREAYRRQVPPALVLGVMLTENDEVKSTARSPQGAVGLMQIHPRPWRPALGKLFGMNLRNDTTNLRYGIFILSHLAKRAATLAEDDAAAMSWRTALLRYNGCVRGTNTADCHRYPDVVRREVQRSARTSCAGRDFEKCVVTPLRLGRRARTE
jgi:soluble lytic murein transglycosylase-like protein